VNLIIPPLQKNSSPLIICYEFIPLSKVWISNRRLAYFCFLLC